MPVHWILDEVFVVAGVNCGEWVLLAGALDVGVFEDVALRVLENGVQSVAFQKVSW